MALPVQKMESTHISQADVKIEDKQTISGHLELQCWVKRQLFFVIKFDKPFIDKKEIIGDKRDKAPQFVLDYDLEKSNELQLKIAFSTVSVAGAKTNLEKEINHWNFEQVKNDAESRWERYLSRMTIEGNVEQKKNFYSSMYHLLI
jgi:putative alpha-1,2-mannosidase